MTTHLPEGAVSPDVILDKRALEARIKANRRAVLIVNTRSRQGQRMYAQARDRLLERGMTLDATFPVRDPVRLPEIVRDALAQGQELVIVGGGDGTISSVVDYFAYRKAVLAILPLGTANSFARTVGMPLSVDEAVDVAVDGRVADVDLGKINDDYFANASAIGLPASIARHMPPMLKRWLGRVGYLAVAGVRLLRHQPFRCTVTTPERTFEFDALEVRIANGQYQGGVKVAEDASVESRDLVVQSINGHSRWSVVRFWGKAVAGQRPLAEDVVVLRAPEFTLDTSPPQYVSIDGEPLTRTPVRASVARQALLLMVPRDCAGIR